ncbi:cell division cycle 5-like protein [Tanacetum coccineum]
MRIMIKGGVWKNTEDEILKAAVMKYGKNQWARISSLLVRKSAKQCKARWYEWLDPSIKKGWLGKLAELVMGISQLRYPVVIAYQTNSVFSVDIRLRRTRAEDEQASTPTCKAYADTMRTIAPIKRRELKAAGIDNRHRKRKGKGIDYNAEIPFEKRPPPCFYDVTDESSIVEQPKFPTTIEELEGERRADKEARLRKQDVARNKIAQRQDAPAAILQANKMNDPETVRKRPKMNLPTPQIPDYELQHIAKFGLPALSEQLSEGSGATRALLADYTQTPRHGMTPIRTPAGKQDAIMMEAENQARLRLSQTPLLGGDNPDLHPSDFSGVTPKKKDIQTPNLMLTPSVMSTPGASGLTPRIGMTPRDGQSFGVTPKGTPIRDELHINEEMEMRDSAKLERARQADMRRNLRSGLTGLPQPKNEYLITVQPVPEDDEEPEEKMEEDMSDRIAQEKAEEEAKLQALLKKRSKVLQRELPRSPIGSLDLIKKSLIKADEDKSYFVPPTLIEQADEMISKELLSLLEHDNTKYPLDEKLEKEKKKGNKRGKSVQDPVIEEFDEDELKEADQLIKEEAKVLRVAMGHEDEDIDELVGILSLFAYLT